MAAVISLRKLRGKAQVPLRFSVSHIPGSDGISTAYRESAVPNLLNSYSQSLVRLRNPQYAKRNLMAYTKFLRRAQGLGRNTDAAVAHVGLNLRAAEVLLQIGVPIRGVRNPFRWYGENGSCHHNARIVINQNPERFLYGEGFCVPWLTVAGTAHAWNGERRNPFRLFDCTWACAPINSYFGIMLTADEFAELRSVSGHGEKMSAIFRPNWWNKNIEEWLLRRFHVRAPHS